MKEVSTLYVMHQKWQRRHNPKKWKVMGYLKHVRELRENLGY